MAGKLTEDEHTALEALSRACALLAPPGTPAVLSALAKGFTEPTDLLDRTPGSTPRTLADRLRELIEAGLIEESPATHYTLTKTGQALLLPLAALMYWGTEFEPGPQCHGTREVTEGTGH